MISTKLHVRIRKNGSLTTLRPVMDKKKRNNIRKKIECYQQNEIGKVKTPLCFSAPLHKHNAMSILFGAKMICKHNVTNVLEFHKMVSTSQ